MIVRRHELDAGQPVLAQPEQEAAPDRAALAMGELDRQNTGAAIA
jgi:hypothetical protein